MKRHAILSMMWMVGISNWVWAAEKTPVPTWTLAGAEEVFSHSADIEATVDWGNPQADLDLSLVLFDAQGVPVGHVWPRDTQYPHGYPAAVSHTGEGAGQERINFSTALLAKQDPRVWAAALVVNSFSQHGFDVVHPSFSVRNGKKELFSYKLGDYTGKTSYVVGVFGKDAAGQWGYKQVHEAGSGKTFRDSFGLIFDNLDALYHAPFSQAGREWVKAYGGSIRLEKDVAYTLDPRSTKSAYLALDWDCLAKTGSSDPVDIDSNIHLLDARGNILEIVWFGNKQSRNGAIIHRGDNRTGEDTYDAAGRKLPDERIDISFDKLPKEVAMLSVNIVVYELNDSFAQLTEAWARFVAIDEKGTETPLCLVDVDQAAGPARAMVIANLVRQPDGTSWRFVSALDTTTGEPECIRKANNKMVLGGVWRSLERQGFLNQSTSPWNARHITGSAWFSYNM